MESPETEGDGSTDGETADDRGDEAGETGETAPPESQAAGTVSLGDDRRLALPADASDEEAAALAVAVATHIDRERGGATETEPASGLDPWTLAGRLRARSRTRLPRSTPRGGAWKAASRYR